MARTSDMDEMIMMSAL